MGQINIRKRGKLYQYQFEIAKIDGKRRSISRCGFLTKGEAIKEGTKAYNDYLTAGSNFKKNEMKVKNDNLDDFIKSL